MPNKNRRRRRRRRKLTTANSTASKTIERDDKESEQSDESLKITNEKDKSLSPKVNVRFINEDVEIETAIMLKHLNRDSEILRKREYEQKFFVSNVNAAELLDLSRSQATINYNMYRDDATKESHEPSTQEYPIDGPQLASFYINNDFTDIVKPFDKQQMSDSGLLQFYLPKLLFPRKFRTDIETPGGGDDDDIVFGPEYGHFVKSKPNVLNRNYAQYVNRLIEESAFEWLDIHTKEIRHIFNVDFSPNHLFRTTCAERFHPNEYEPLNVAFELDGILVQDRILRIDMKHITFDRHPLFNDEQQIARELEILYDEYGVQCQNQILQTIETKSNVLRQLLNTISNQSQQSVAVGDNLRAYRDELKEMRLLWHRESTKQRELLQKILEHWTKLKKAREKATVHSTSIKLLIRSHEPDINQDTYEWNHKFSVEFNEMLQDAMILYREHKQQRKQKTKRNNAPDTEPNDGIKSGGKMPKPNANVIENELLELFGQSMRPPGEQIIDLELEQTGGILDKNQPKYIVRILLDNEQLQFPDSQRLNSVGQAQLNATYSIKFTTRIPQRLKFLVRDSLDLSFNLSYALNENTLSIPIRRSSKKIPFIRSEKLLKSIRPFPSKPIHLNQLPLRPKNLWVIQQKTMPAK